MFAVSEHTLKNGAKVRIECHSLTVLTDLIEMTSRGRGGLRLPSYSYVGQELIQWMKDTSTQYVAATKEGTLHAYEHQKLHCPYDRDYHRVFIAKDMRSVSADRIVGITVLRWERDRDLHKWLYSLALTEVPRQFRNLGIATALHSAVDSSRILSGKVLRLSEFIADGERFLQGSALRALKAQDYVVLPSGYCYGLPTENGNYCTTKYPFI